MSSLSDNYLKSSSSNLHEPNLNECKSGENNIFFLFSFVEFFDKNFIEMIGCFGPILDSVWLYERE